MSYILINADQDTHVRIVAAALSISIVVAGIVIALS
jgi:hypothetical protein